MENRWKFYTIIGLIVLSLFLYKKVYLNYFNNVSYLKKKKKRYKKLNAKLEEKIKTYPKIKSQLAIEEKKLKNIKNRLFKAHNPNEVLENLQKYLFDYFQKQDININNYRQLRLIESKFFYRCRFEINSIIDFNKLVNVFEFLDNSNYLIKIPEIYIYYTRRRKESLLRTRIVFETIYIKEDFNETKN